MALSLGTNSGFVTTAPTTDPAGSAGAIDGSAFFTKHTTPSNASRITEVGIYLTQLSGTDVNFEVGLYSSVGGVPSARLYVDAVNSTGTTSGWKVVTVDWAVNPSTDYFIAGQVDTSAGTWYIDTASTGGDGYDTDGSETTLKDPADAGTLLDSNGMIAMYAVVVGSNTGCKINIGDVWKDASKTSFQINIGDVWKTVSGVQINIGDVWKPVL